MKRNPDRLRYFKALLPAEEGGCLEVRHGSLEFARMGRLLSPINYYASVRDHSVCLACKGWMQRKPADVQRLP